MANAGGKPAIRDDYYDRKSRRECPSAFQFQNIFIIRLLEDSLYINIIDIQIRFYSSSHNIIVCMTLMSDDLLYNASAIDPPLIYYIGTLYPQVTGVLTSSVVGAKYHEYIIYSIKFVRF